MASLWKRIFESDEDRRARQRKEVMAEREKPQKPTRMKVAPPQQAPSLGGTIDALKRRKKYLSNL